MDSGLEAAGKPIDSNDLLIASDAYTTGATVVTTNIDEFKRIRGLKVENWLEDTCEQRGSAIVEEAPQTRS
jgi:predicted nucleic acid-binding protein